jgi:formylglycine-generating enzyme required for sulfatase activity
MGPDPNSYNGLPVRSFAPNKFGIYDVIGNVFEITATCRQAHLNKLS